MSSEVSRRGYDTSKKQMICTAFRNVDDFHATKDPGMIPYFLSKMGNFLVTIPVWSNRSYPTWEKLFPEAEFPAIEWSDSEKIRIRRMSQWIHENGHRIDILHTYFWDRGTLLYILNYKRANPQGVIYIHLDSDGNQWVQYDWPNNILKKAIMHILLNKRFLGDVLFGLQNKENAKKITGRWPFTNLIHVPNGFTWPEDLPYIPFNDRNNVILTVARNGTQQKRTDILMNGFANVAQEFPEWKLVLAGTVEEDFKPFINSYFVKYPELKDRVRFVGPISDRSELQNLYASSKIFALPSAWESFGLVTVEAMSQGCYVVESDIPANKDITCNGKYGSLHKCLDEEDFTKKLKEALCNPDYMASVSEAAYDYVNKNYHWKKTLKPVYDWIQMKLEEKEKLTQKLK